MPYTWAERGGERAPQIRRSQTAAKPIFRSDGNDRSPNLTIPSRPRESRTFRHFAKNGFARLILSGNSAPGNYETVLRIDRRDCQGQIGEFLFREMLACFLKDFGGYVTLLDVCDRFGPGAQRSV